MLVLKQGTSTDQGNCYLHQLDPLPSTHESPSLISWNQTERVAMCSPLSCRTGLIALFIYLQAILQLWSSEHRYSSVCHAASTPHRRYTGSSPHPVASAPAVLSCLSPSSLFTLVFSDPLLDTLVCAAHEGVVKLTFPCLS